MKTKIEWQKGVHFIANTESGNKIKMDGPVDSGGENNGARPTELLISGMGGCTAFDVMSIAKQKNIKILSFEIDIDASRTETKPSLINKIHLTYKIKAENTTKQDLEKIIKISLKKQCSCCIIIGKSVDISYSLEII
jgi:putative redox protein